MLVHLIVTNARFGHGVSAFEYNCSKDIKRLKLSSVAGPTKIVNTTWKSEYKLNNYLKNRIYIYLFLQEAHIC